MLRLSPDRTHPPRLFVIKEDGSGVEFLPERITDAALDKIKQNVSVTLSEDELPGESEVKGITIIQKIVSPIAPSEPGDIPKSVSSDFRGILDCSGTVQATVARNLLKHPKLPAEIQSRLISVLESFQDHLADIDAELNSEALDERTDEEKAKQKDIQKILLEAANREKSRVEEEKIKEEAQVASLLADHESELERSSEQPFRQNSKIGISTPSAFKKRVKLVPLEELQSLSSEKATNNPSTPSSCLPHRDHTALSHATSGTFSLSAETQILPVKSLAPIIPEKRYQSPLGTATRTSLGAPKRFECGGFLLSSGCCNFGTLMVGGVYQYILSVTNSANETRRFKVKYPKNRQMRIIFDASPVAAGMTVKVVVEIRCMEVCEIVDTLEIVTEACSLPVSIVAQVVGENIWKSLLESQKTSLKMVGKVAVSFSKSEE
eukprot:TRINITY_DN17322_c0_g1_i1.p1 TRINITY_DN17322_c0_g1~~TRINITY_DN17322_c0_g1_i1.p1  ORF type:complete len:435 (-),score=118.58 TRINITY_DN17322_c0_g1_i1:24-1328(-)